MSPRFVSISARRQGVPVGSASGSRRDGRVAHGRRFKVRGLLLLAALMSGLFSLVGLKTAGAQDVTTWHNDAARSGVQAKESILTPANVNSTTFGKVFSLPVVGDVYAQPLYLSQITMADGLTHNVLFVATAQDYVYAFDADGNNPAQGYLWSRSLLGTGETWVVSADVNTGDITPNIGVTGTPVIDRTGNTLYVVAKSKTTGSPATFVQRLHALDLTTGAEKLNGPTTIQATVPGTGDGGTTISFNPLLNNQRPALLLAPTPSGATPNSVFLAWASHGDNGAYHGWVISYNAANISQQTGVWPVSANGGQGGIWMSGGGLSSDGLGNIFGASGNGTFDANLAGVDYGDSAFRLTLTGTSLAPQDFFTPANQASLSGQDNDVGTSAVLLLPQQPGALPHLALTTDKSGQIHLLNRDSMGKYTTPNNSSVQSFGIGRPIHSSLLFFNNLLYMAADGGPVQVWSFNPQTQRFNTQSVAGSPTTYGCGGCDGAGATPGLSANGTANAVLWAIDNSAFGSGPAILHAYDPANAGTEFYNSSQAASNGDAAAVAVKFTTPTIANGRVYVGGQNAITVYGLRGNAASPTAAPTFSPAAGSYSTAQKVTISSSTPGASIYYTTDGSTPSTDSTLYSGPVTVPGTETIRAVALAPGYGQSASSTAAYQIVVNPSGEGAVPFGYGFPAGSMQLNGSATISGGRLRLNDGGNSEASSAFYATQVDVEGFRNDFDFQLTNPNADGFTFVVQGTGKTALGTTGGGLGYGSDGPTGTGIAKSIAIKFDLYSNQGEGSDSTGLYTGGASPQMPSTDLTSTGVNLHSGNIFHVSMAYDGTTLYVRITDTVTKATTLQSYTVNIPSLVGGPLAYVGFTGGTGGLTAIQEIVDWVFAPTPHYPSTIAPTSGLALNGQASFNTGRLRLTGAGAQASTAYYPTKVPVSSFVTNFNFQLTKPNADGFTFVLQNSGLQAKGGSGGALAFGADPAHGIAAIGSSVAIKFDIYSNAGEGPNSTGIYVNGASPTLPATNLTGSGIDLHSGHIFNAALQYDGTKLTVTITDTMTGKTAVQTYTVNIPATVGDGYAYAGFTAGTGGANAIQEVLTWTYQ